MHGVSRDDISPRFRPRLGLELSAVEIRQLIDRGHRLKLNSLEEIVVLQFLGIRWNRQILRSRRQVFIPDEAFGRQTDFAAARSLLDSHFECQCFFCVRLNPEVFLEVVLFQFGPLLFVEQCGVEVSRSFHV